MDLSLEELNKKYSELKPTPKNGVGVLSFLTGMMRGCPAPKKISTLRELINKSFGDFLLWFLFWW